jgi:hypothetical protein
MSNYKNDAYKVCDYITLNIASADSLETPGQYTWSIPDSAYKSVRRGQICSVEVVSGVFIKSLNNAGANYGLNVEYVNGSYNSTSSAKGSPIIAHCDSARAYTYLCHGAGAILCQARPNRISLAIRSFTANPEADGANKNPLISGAGFNGSITLKYSYYDVETTNDSLKSEFNNVQF